MASGMAGCTGMMGMGSKGPYSFSSIGLPQFSGTAGARVIAGMTGTLGSALFCDVCKKTTPLTHLYQVNENLDLFFLLERDRDSGHIICEKCFRRTKRLFKIIDKMGPVKLPLYVSHPNFLVRIRTSKRLESV